LEYGINKGQSAASIARDIKSYLNEPNKLFRRVKDEQGVLRLSKAAKAYNPGRGRYRSSYKNAFRLTRNETNFSYEGAQYAKNQQQDFVVGIEIKVSPSHNPADDKGGISCLSLEGKYPKDFDFTYKWHVNCKCTSFTILKSKEELDSDLDKILAGEKPNTPSKNSIYDKPENFNKYIVDNPKKFKNPGRTFEANKDLKSKISKDAEQLAIEKINKLPKGTIFDDAKRIDSIFEKSSYGYSETLEAFEKHRDTGVIEFLSVDKIKITQPNIQSNKVFNMIKTPDKLPIINVVEFKDGEYVIFDGHHRLTSFWALNKREFKAFLVKL